MRTCFHTHTTHAKCDPKTGKATIEIIDQLHKETNKTIVIIEHRLEDVLHRDIDRVILMERGEIVADMTPDEILASELLASTLCVAYIITTDLLNNHDLARKG